MYTRLLAAINENSESVRAFMEHSLFGKGYSENLIEAMKYTALSGGKAIRPFLVSEFYKLSGGKDCKYINYAAAVEMVHSYSLIHDDLPCMDNDPMRRGMPSNHIINGEAGALLAGDGLLTKAFEVISDADLSAESRIRAVKILSSYAGPDGMVGGQQLDCEQTTLTEAKLTSIHEGKTVALIKAACQLGVAANEAADNEIYKIAEEYAYNIGMAFQIIDDILDVTGDKATLGKSTGSDAKNGKMTFVTLYGVERSREMANELTGKAKRCLPSDEKSTVLQLLADYLLERIK